MTYQGKDRFQRKLEVRARKRERLAKISTGFKVLTVDDDPNILQLVETALECIKGYDVFCASNAAEALDIVAAEEEPFDCILLDIQMPDMSGTELLCELRSMPDYAETPILMLTAMSERKYIDEAFLEGATDYVNKPFDFLELDSRIQRSTSMVESRRKSEKNSEWVDDMRRKLVLAQEFKIEEPISISGLKQFLRYFEFDSYVAQIARGKMFGTQAMSVIIHGADVLFEKAGCDSLRSVIEDVAVIVQDATKDLNCVFSYRGNGVFMLILHDHKDVVAQHGTADLGEVLAKEFDRHVADPHISVLVGDPVAMNPLLPRAASGALQKSLAAAQRLEHGLRKRDKVVPFKLSVEEPVAQNADPKRLYESVLDELFGEDNYRNVR